MKEYKISVKLNTLDMYCFLMRHEYGSFSGLFGLAVSLLSLAALIAGVGKDDRNTQILLGLVAVCFTILNPLRLFFRAQKQLTLNPTFHKPITYTFGEAGMHIAQGEEQMDVAWAEMKKLVRGKRIMILYLSKVVGYIFPKSQCNGQYEEIAAMIQLKMAQAQTEGAQVLEEHNVEETETKTSEEPDSGEEVPKETLEELLHAARKRSGGKKTARTYDMPPGEAEIWGDEETK